MIEHRYPPAELTRDYVRAGFGLVVTGVPLLSMHASPVIMWVLAVFAALFAIFGVRTAIRHMTIVRVDGAGIAAVGPMGVSIDWNDLGRMALSYYSTRRDRTRGWMQLRLSGGGRTLRLDSTVEGFRDIVAIAARHAELKRLELNPATIGNLAALGIEVHTPAAAAEPGRA